MLYSNLKLLFKWINPRGKNLSPSRKSKTSSINRNTYNKINTSIPDKWNSQIHLYAPEELSISLEISIQKSFLSRLTPTIKLWVSVVPMDKSKYTIFTREKCNR